MRIRSNELPIRRYGVKEAALVISYIDPRDCISPLKTFVNPVFSDHAFRKGMGWASASGGRE